MHHADEASLATLTRVFPAGSIRTSDDERINPSNAEIVEVILLPLGKLDFGKGQVAKI